MICLFAVVLMRIEIAFYSTEILITYIFMVAILVEYLMDLPESSFRISLSLAFLLVYVNSWYWEGILHIWAIQENGLNFNQIIQLLHLAPVPYLLYRWSFEVKEAINWLTRGFAFSTIIALMKFYRVWKYLPIIHTAQTVFIFNHGLMWINRLFCLWVLYTIFVSHAIYNRNKANLIS